MIARIWHGITDTSRADEYYEFLQRSGITDYQGTEGNLGVYVLRRQDGNDTHFTLISLWDSYEAIKRFAGDDIRIAHYYPEDSGFLREMEPYVEHHEVLYSPQSR